MTGWNVYKIERKRQGEERSITDYVFQVKNWRHQMKLARGKFVKKKEVKWFLTEILVS